MGGCHTRVGVALAFSPKEYISFHRLHMDDQVYKIVRNPIASALNMSFAGRWETMGQQGPNVGAAGGPTSETGNSRLRSLGQPGAHQRFVSDRFPGRRAGVGPPNGCPNRQPPKLPPKSPAKLPAKLPPEFPPTEWCHKCRPNFLQKLTKMRRTCRPSSVTNVPH